MIDNENLLNNWLESHELIAEFERSGALPANKLDKWKFYYSVQDALNSLPSFISKDAIISKTAEISGNVVIEAGAQILPFSIINGPAYIGKNVIVGNFSFVRAFSFIAHDCLIGNHTYCNEAVLAPKAMASHFCGISRSILEKNCNVSAFVMTATKRADSMPIKINSLSESDAPAKQGCIIGENSFISTHCTILPGIQIGSDCFVGSSMLVTKDVPNGIRTKLKVIVENDLNTLTIKERIPNSKVLFNDEH